MLFGNDHFTASYQRKKPGFVKLRLEKNTLANMMATISRQGELSQRYTNHSIRSTAITVLDEAGLFPKT